MKSPLITDLTPADHYSMLELPADRPRPPVSSFRGATRALRLTAAATASLRQAAWREKASLDVLLLAGLAALLARYSGAEDLVIGAAGPTSLLPLRIQWTGDPAFAGLVASTDGALRAALANADLPFEAPLQVLFAGPTAVPPAEGLERLPSGERELAVDLALSVREVEGGGGEPQLLLTLDYAVDFFDAATAARLLEHYAALLAGAAAAPELPLSRLPLLGESERHQMLVEWNDTASAFPRRTLHKLFEEQAAARPDAVAVVWDGGTLTYGELDRQAGRIARRLRRLGVGRESRVALYLERSPEMVAAVLGVLKAGGVYLPIDLSYPRERLELLLEDAAPMAVVGTTRSLASLPGKVPQLAVDLLAVHPATARDLARRLGAGFAPDEPAKALVDRLAGVYRANDGDTRALMRTMAEGAQAPAAEAEEEELSADVPPESLAYVLYTSGSTGTPNGVEVTHEAVVRLVRETGYFPFGSGNVFLQIALLSFDASTLELWGPLANGGCVALPPPGRFALGDLYEQVERHGVTAIFLTTGLFHVAVEEGLAGLAGLRHLLIGGDVMSRSHLERAIAALPEVELIHCYGPTENTVFTSTWRVRHPLAEGSVTIGRLISTVRAYVLDPTLAPVPMGCAGELYLAGPGLARGYLHRRELTAERFLPNPFEEGRLYKTGDLVRWRPDGTLAFLGRHDFQVKVRGFRIEPGEIEAALLLHPQVREAAVVGLAEGGRDHRVVAYYVTEAGAETTREELRAFLRARLPEHMVPAVLVPLAALPLTDVGKLDRRALPAPEALEPAAGEPATALGAGVHDPSDLGDLVMEMLAGLWEDVLDPDPRREPAADVAMSFERSALERSRRIGPHDDFFDLGGHSLTVMRLLSRIRQTFGVELGAQTVFAFPTLAAQARVVAAARRGVESALPPLVKVPRQGLPALSFAQQRLWFLDRLAPESPLYNVPSTYRLAGPLAPAALAAGLSEIVRRHEALRTRFVEVDGEPRQEIGAPWQVALPQVDLRGLGRERRPGELARLRTEEAGRPFNLDRGPLLRAGLVRLDEEEHALLLTVHHIVYDGWSEGVLTAELTALYAAALAGRPSPLGELAVQYADFAAWQRAWPPEVLGRQLAWWRDELAGAPAALPLPVDRQRPAAPSFRGASAMLRLPAAAAALRQAARREGTTLYMLLLAGFAALLARVTGEEDLPIGTPVADRPRPEVEGLIGFFVNTVVIRARAAGDPSFRGLLATVRDTALGAFAHQDLPFEMLVEELRPERERSRNPLVQVLFSFQGAGQATAGTADDAAGLRLVRLPWGERSTAKLDLVLSAMEMPVEPPGESNEAELTLVLEYATDLFTATTAARFLGHYATLVAGAAASPTSPELPLSSLPLLSAPERHQLVEWNDTASDFPLRPVHRLFEEQAAARPDAIAVSWEGGAMSYGELDRRSGEVARHLRRLGVATDARVGLVVERSPEMLEAILGILKAGGGYLPLDPTYPRERLALLLADAAPAAVVGPRRLLAALPDIPSGTPRLALEDVDSEVDAEPFSADVPPTSLAYVIYTSGSTGAPKGVEVSHRGVVRLVREAGYTSFGPGEVYLQTAPMSFDLTTLEIWGPLLNGGRLALLPPGPYTLADIYAAVARQGVTTLWLASAFFNLAVEEGLAPLGGLRLLEVGGDVVSRPHVERALAALPGTVDLLNGYGPTENTMFSTTHRLRGGLAAGEASVPIGRPISGSSAYVLDRSLAPLPVACVGELYVGGAGVARGYLGRPALTAERFVPDPFSADPRDPRGGDRLYRTGDLARWRPDGTLDFLGRRDFQVKVRGFRVEPGEVESALLRHPGVREAVVTAVAEAAAGRHPESAGGHRLVAYYVPEGADGPAPAELRIHLRESLPEHMVPSLFVPLAELPLNANGKVDRRALPAPEARLAGEAEDAPRTPPRNPVEEVIAGIWEDLLGLGQPVGVDDDFFHLGGHSLLAIRLLARLRAVLGADLSVQQVFDAPTIAGLAEAVARALVSGDAAAGPALPPLAPRAFADTGSADAAAPLSYAQQRLWFLDRLAPWSPAYNVPSAYGLAGPLAPAALAAALAEVVRRHEILRARFVERDGEPELEIAAAPGFLPLPLVDLGALTPGRRSAELANLRAAEAERPFDLAAGPLLRAGLVRLGAEEHVLLLDFHHAVYDGWSEGVLLRELPALYDAARAGTPSPLAEPTLQYADFAAWQRAWPPEVLGRQLAYWRGQLAGAPTVLELPADRPRPAVASLRGASRPRLLGAPEAARLHQVARREGATLYMLLLAAFAATLARHGGQEDLLVATPVANRTRPELEGLIGFFVNTLVLRVRLAGDPDFHRVLASVRQTALAAFAHQDLPFEALVEELRPERDLSRAPLVQAMLSLGRAAPERSLGGLHLARLPSPEKTTAKLDLSLAATELTELAGEDGGQSLLLGLEYATDLFTATAAERFLAHFATLLCGAAEAPELPLSRLPLLAPAERHQLVAEWNDTASGFPERTLHGLFAEQAAARPDAVAVSWEAGEMSYGELDRRSDEIARHLRRLGVATDARVALVVERSPEMVAALLGILKAGGGYLPLDPSYPRERLALLLADAAPAAVVGPRHLLAALPEIPNGAPRLAFEDALSEADTGADAALTVLRSADVPPASLAYVLYTSGSTGTPKGVEVSHRAVVRLVRETGFAAFGPSEVFLQLSPMSFDLATFEIWGPLLNGGRLALLPPGPFTVAGLYAAVERHRVTTIWLTSGLFHLAVEEGLAPLGGLRQLVAGGDVLSRPHVLRALEALPDADLINGYGPTENTTFSTTHRLRDGLPAGEPSVPIGRPIAASRAYVLDLSLTLLPAGCVGELYVGGAGVARGYLGRPALTAERFLPDPFSTDPRGEDRLYRTGDLARWRPDGTFDFLGRHDFQVKVRGFRVEPGEVETALLGHPGVREAVVTAAKESAGGHRLVAYYVPEGAGGPAPADLRLHLRESLPEHMMPSLFVPLAELPLNANGKVDRRALPSPEAIGEADTAPRTPPRNPVEEVIAGIWEDLLGLGDPVGVDDDFFHLGGHSLLVIRLLSRLRQAFGADLPVQRVFAAPTVAGLAAAIAAILAAGRREEALPPIMPLESRHGVLPLSYPQRRLDFMDRLAPESPTYNIPSGYLLRGPFAPAALAAALAEVVRRHEALRTRIVADAHGEPGQEVGPPPAAPTPPPFVDLSGLPPARRAPELTALAGREAGRGFDLRRDPMLRATLVRLGEDEHAFLFTVHHIASDGWSEGVLRRELSALYAAALAGEPSPLAPLPLQYADFAAWQRAWPEEALAAQLAHWKERLAGTPALDLPADRPRPPVASFRGDSLRLDLPPALADALRRLARRGQATVFMTVLAVWHALLQRHSGQTDFAIGTPVANRTRPELEPLIGVFLNMLALRTDGGGDPSFAELLARVRHTALAAYDHADVPFERIVDEVNVARDRSRPPLVQTMLALNSTPRVPLTLRGLAVEPLDLSARVSRFDLSLALSEQGGELGGGLEYSTDLFDRTTMARLAGHLVHLLAAVADDPSRRVAAIELLSPAERQQVAVELNDTAADLSAVFGGSGDAEPLLHRWIERQAALTPDATAVVGESESLTYRELDARANRLARRLRRLGVRVDEPVAICADRSPALIVGLLAILKAGGAYLPLDPSYPSERLAFMVEDGLDGVAKPVLLAQVDLLAASVAGAGARLIDLDSAAGPAGDADDPLLAPLDGGAGADNLAYVIYTSGSTGRPKGVMSTHRGIVNRIAWMQRAYGLTPADRVLQKTPVSFDVSVWELFWPLAVGARLVLARPAGHRDPAYLMRRIEEQEVTTLHFVPSMLQVFLAQPGLGRCRSLRRVMASGEALPAELAARFHELLGGAPGPAPELHNLYGPTEASVDVTAHRTLPGPARRAVPIGRPIANLGLWLLDPELQPVPLGVPGELYIGGTGLARGYLRRPGLTAERFVPHPLGRPGERLYRTGDLARFSADGEIEFLGRNDDQVKLRGFRIEPGEIEAALASHPAVREAAVVAREEGPGEVRLTAYVVPAGPGPRPEAGELRDALRRVLPEHMVPADFALVDALPLTPSGKVDRGALRARLPADELAPAAEPGGDLETEIEELVAGIWQDLLRRGPIGRDDNLFDLGAHSILAIQFTFRVSEALGLEIPLRLLLESPTVRRLGAAIQELLIEQMDSLTDEEAELLAEKT
ncbi:MAG TPA: amino acid adenylation domain-containing protein [Thermoanaerobaculia bacterium]|nr:amino acid adenylation domain-containing protein [Thermoanaerobaculia bacterium]